jgi:glycosyltransferase involved in cell wall biosynthesis
MIHTVVQYLDATTCGGCEEVALTLLCGLDRDHWRPVLLHHDEPALARLVERAVAAGVESHALPPKADCGPWHAVTAISTWLKQLKPAVFHAHLSWPLACRHAVLAARLAGVRAVVATSHLYFPLHGVRFGGLKRSMQTAALDRYIAVSEQVGHHLHRDFDVPLAKLRVVRNGIPLAPFDQCIDPSLRDALREGTTRPIVFTPARLHTQKGHRYLLAAARQVPDALFLLAGDGPERDDLQRMAAELGVADRVRFLGHRPDVTKLLLHCDLFVLPSLFEGLPLSVLEAMAAGKPVIATDVGGTDEVVTHGVSGLLVRPADPDALANAINAVLGDPAKAARLGAAGQARVRQLFRAETMVQGVQEVYREVLRQPPAPAPASKLGTGAWKIAAFFAVLAAAGVLLDAAIGAGLRRVETSEFGVWNKIIGGRANADILITGSSRALTHFDARIIQARTGRTAFNIGLNGSQTDMQVARLKTYLRHNRKPALLIHNLDAFSFQVTHGEAYDPGQYVPYLAEPELYETLRGINPQVWKSRWLPLYGYAVDDLRMSWLIGLARLLPGRGAEDHFLGYKPRHSPWTGEFERFRAQNPNGRSVAVEREGLRQMENLLRLCRQEGIAVVLVYSPEYAPVQALTTNRAHIFSLFEDLSARHGARLIDYSHSAISAQREYFYNSQHLNAAGATEFTQDLVGRLLGERIVAAASAAGPAP